MHARCGRMCGGVLPCTSSRALELPSAALIIHCNHEWSGSLAWSRCALSGPVVLVFRFCLRRLSQSAAHAALASTQSLRVLKYPSCVVARLLVHILAAVQRRPTMNIGASRSTTDSTWEVSVECAIRSNARTTSPVGPPPQHRGGRRASASLSWCAELMLEPAADRAVDGAVDGAALPELSRHKRIC